MSFKLPCLVIILLAALEIAPFSSARIFLTGRNYPSGGTPVAVVVQDFNNDEIADIASANGTVSVFLDQRWHFRCGEHFSCGSRRDGNSQR
jgi:hypothetical protein